MDAQGWDPSFGGLHSGLAPAWTHQHHGLFSTELGGSCRYTSWSRQPADVDRVVEEMVEEEAEFNSEEDEIEMAGNMLHKLSAVPPEAPEQAQHCNFSWKELELSCKTLDDAHITISQIDLSCIDEASGPSLDGSNVVCNFHVEAEDPVAANQASPRRHSLDSFSTSGVRTPFVGSERSSPAGSGELQSVTSKSEQFNNPMAAQVLQNRPVTSTSHHSRFWDPQAHRGGEHSDSASSRMTGGVDPNLVGATPKAASSFDRSTEAAAETFSMQFRKQMSRQDSRLALASGGCADAVPEVTLTPGKPAGISNYARSVALKLGLAIHRYGNKKHK